MEDPGRDGLPAWRTQAAGVLAGGRLSLVLPLALAVALFVFPFAGGSVYWVREIALIGVYALVVSGVNLSFGYAGEVQFGQVFIFAGGAYLTMALAIHGIDDIILLLLIGAVAAALLGFMIALPAMRIGGWPLAMVSFFLVFTIPDITTLLPGLTGGENGLFAIPTPKLFGSVLTTDGLYEVTIVTTLLWFVCYRNLVTSRFGVVFRVLRESPVLTSSLAFSPLRLKVMAYSLGAAPAGVAGCLFGFLSLTIDPSDFGFSLAVGVVAASVLGGIESVYGVLVGAAVLQLGPEKSLSFADDAPIAFGLFLVIAAIVLRQGIGGLAKGWAGRTGARLSGRPLHRMSGADDAYFVEAAGAGAVDGDVPHWRGPSGDGAALRVAGVSRSFGGVAAVDSVTLSAEAGRVTALIGANGSGKTTLLNLICGYLSADEGEITFGSERISGLSASRVARTGVGRTFQTPQIPRGVSVRDVVASGRFYADRSGLVPSVLRLPRYGRTRQRDTHAALAALQLVGLRSLASEEASDLPLGMRRLVEVARALCGGPQLVLLDEPASGLSDAEVERLGTVIRAAADAGCTVVVIEHNFGFVTRVSDTVHVLNLGSTLASGPAATIAADPAVIATYLGGAEDDDTGVTRIDASPSREPAEKLPPAVLTVRDACTGYGDLQVLRGVSLAVQKGEVTTVLGRNGVGKTTLLSLLAGQLPLWSGSMSRDGENVGRQPAYRRAAGGLAFVQEGKRIFRDRTIWQNVLIGTYALHLDKKERLAHAHEILTGFPVLEARADERAGGLSGGQQQMLAIAQALASRPSLLLLDEPSAGLSPAIVDEVFSRVRDLADCGLSVLLVEQLAGRAIAISDHVSVMDDGLVVRSGRAAEFSDLSELEATYFGGGPTVA